MAKNLPHVTACKGSYEDAEVYCQPCEQEGTILPAHGFCTDCNEHLCEICFKVHKRHKLSKQHTLLDKDNMPHTLQHSQTSDHASDDFTEPCPKHRKEIVKFYCHDHKELLCSVCVTLKHPVTSCNVNYIDDISGQVANSKEYRHVLNAMNAITNQCQKITANVKTLTEKSNSSLTDVLVDMKTFRQEINQRIDEMEKQAEIAVKVKQLKNDETRKTVETSCDDFRKSLKESSDSMKHLNKSKYTNRLFLKLKYAEQIIKEYEKTIHKLSTFNVKTYTFKPSEELSSVLENEMTLGALAQQLLIELNPPTVADINSRYILHRTEICVKTSEDKSRCLITGMTLLGCPIITDWSNCAIKMVDTSEGVITHQLQLDGNPWDLCPVTTTELAVTLPYIQTIQFISVFSEKFAEGDALEVDGECHGICFYRGNLFVTFLNPGKLEILETNGTVLTTIKGGNILNSPSYVTTSYNGIYVSDHSSNTVTRFNWKGDVTGYYGGLDVPEGIALSDDGTVFVCYTKRNVVEQIAGDCSTANVVLEDLEHPCAVCWCAETSTLYISCSTADKRLDNFLQVFKLS